MSRRAKGLSLSFKKMMLWSHLDGKCHVCQIKTDLYGKGSRDPKMATVEHIKPKSKGGTDSWANITLLCHACNQNNANKEKFNLYAPLAHYAGDGNYMSFKKEKAFA